ncbi:hypothetical protein [Clostridium botulinum]|uniref:hypothetical protein n=1 Tax=Clostridium botulinum TaxID=1491 RepID=UPI000773673D|nr:hypothetical protein [Clostridium botulinum]MBY6930122.1 hypothetical protein [Clostridium botulinum]NFG19314.1 hypothetical protein [Clostridium botulinum]NFL87632.1 hypothetical protein [Clostridium botulinum]NFO20304.1 hypothetical protein [Clostridium botulinum]NFO81459.1 hypothetical protein [Clostridium botulinum]
MIDENEKRLLDELNEIRFLESENEDEDEMEDEIQEKIERYEEIVFELSKIKKVEIIPYLCEIAEDRATESSSVEYLIKMIIKIAENDIDEGIKYIIEGTVSMIPKAYYKALFLHTLIIADNDLRDNYITSLQNSNEEEKTISKMLLLHLKRKFKEESTIDYILKNL